MKKTVPLILFLLAMLFLSGCFQDPVVFNSEASRSLTWQDRTYKTVMKKDCPYAYDPDQMVYLFRLDSGGDFNLSYNVFWHKDDTAADYLYLIPAPSFLRDATAYSFILKAQ